jgi:hypothetical protein
MPPRSIAGASIGIWLVLAGCARLDALLICIGAVLVLLCLTDLAERFFEASE